ncbi:winged helix-turn-helix transcriptional regulator [Leuconostoc gasicomitatum]|uniref:winged helix-turn-helix transcriptional regulator n=1 Tax=Leuconostoc gasicomitatum TaxID=115778 RepID=UPI001CC54295|nr:transcriptional regulator [Leuconostoc gasicomitatum]MBZ5946579.1 transcriptional regulator [Leuconostoc gasicomitatum]
MSTTCPVQDTIAVVKGKFTVEILEAIHNGYNHYGMLKNQIPTIPPQIAYHFTDKGLKLLQLVPEIKAWYGDYHE